MDSLGAKSTEPSGVDTDVARDATDSECVVATGSNMSLFESSQCPITQKSHSNLIGFNLKNCPVCGQGLSGSERTIGTNLRTGNVIRRLPNNAEDVAEPQTGLVKHTVTFTDLQSHPIRTVPWPEPFNLQEARTNLGSSELAFEIITELQTSISSGAGGRMSSWNPREYEHAVSEPSAVTFGRGILNDPLKIFFWQTMLLMQFTSQDAGMPSLGGLVLHQLEAFLEFFKRPKYTLPLEEEISRNERGYCTFPMLWHLMRPGITVYLSRDGRLGAHVIAKVNLDRKMRFQGVEATLSWGITLWHLDFDGRHVGRCEVCITIPAFEGERPITSLKIFPVEYHDEADGGKTRVELESMGKQWFGYLMGTQAHYNGEFMGPLGRQFDGRVFIDSAAYIEEHSANLPPPPPPPPPQPYDTFDYPPPAKYFLRPQPSYDDIPVVGDVGDMGEGRSVCACDECHGKRVHPPPGFLWKDYDLIDPSTTKNLELPGGMDGPNHRYLLCSRRLFGFVFKSRDWEVLDVRFCSLPRIQPDAIKSLVMPEERKITIQALVQQYNTASSNDGIPKRTQWGADFIESKGEGQIFLLHGGPGVGKSLYVFSSFYISPCVMTDNTAKLTRSEECIAEFTNRPLLSLNVGDIGTFEEKVEKRLSFWFGLAEKWGAVMLIDEADVYLERRSVSDLQRNGIVSVFLRCMEYYRGILFLTTNRIGHFDDAFISRIHLVIHYEPLGESDRYTIWKQFFAKLEDERTDIMVTGRARSYVLNDPEITKVKWNGREIRNGNWPNPVALADYEFSAKEIKAEYETAQLDQKHFQQICGMALKFKGYLDNLHGMDEHGRAFAARARIDE
ncbi:hypothetical protein PG987_004954 [Apiospora arundinis]